MCTSKNRVLQETDLDPKKILQDKIRKKQEELNKIVAEDIDRDRVLEFSQELDVLISHYLGIVG